LVDGEVVVDAAEQSVVGERELIARHQLAAACHAAEAVDVVDVAARAHHQVCDAEAAPTARALGAEQSAPLIIIVIIMVYFVLLTMLD